LPSRPEPQHPKKHKAHKTSAAAVVAAPVAVVAPGRHGAGAEEASAATRCGFVFFIYLPFVIETFSCFNQMVEAAKNRKGWRSIVQAVAWGRHRLDSTR